MSDDQDIPVRLQYGALPYRLGKSGEVELLLITSRTTRRWIIPKGWPIKARKPWQTAEIEARQEAGVCGVMGKAPVGRFRYRKLLDEDGRLVPCEVTVFPLRVTRTLAKWPEQAERDVRWMTPAKATSVLADPELRAVVAASAASLAKDS